MAEQLRMVVTGGAGFIGANLVKLLINRYQHQVLIIDKLTYAGNRSSIATELSSGQATLCRADICEPESWQAEVAAFQPDVVFHLAAESHVDRSIDAPEAFVKTNVLGTYQLLRVCQGIYEDSPASKRDRFRFVHVSTDEVYGSLAPDAEAFHEATRYDPHSPYSATKAGSDHLARAWYDTYRFPVCVTNCSNNYGPYQFPEKLIPVVILNALHGRPIPVYGAGENVRDWLYVTDHAEALHRVGLAGQPGETYNVGGGNELTNLDLVRTLCGILDRLVPVAQNTRIAAPSFSKYADLITFVTDRPGHDLRYAINASKVERDLSWTPVESVASGLEKTVVWYLDNEAWWQDILSGDYVMERLGAGRTNRS